MNAMNHIILNNNVAMPVLGFGVYQIEDSAQCERSVRDALELGYRSIDTAQAYRNENAVGRAVSGCGIPREELFITTKVWISNGGYEKARVSIDESLKKLRLDYLDLLLVHQPFNDYYGTWRAMEEAYRTGKVRAIGVSNFYPDRLVDLCRFVEIPPAVNQVETHVFWQQAEARAVMKKLGVAHESWGPFAEGRNGFFTNPVLADIGRAHGKTVAQVALRHLVQQGIIAIPKSVNRDRIEENFHIFDFELTATDMRAIAALDEGKSAFLSHSDPETVEFLAGWQLEESPAASGDGTEEDVDIRQER